MSEHPDPSSNSQPEPGPVVPIGPPPHPAQAPCSTPGDNDIRRCGSPLSTRSSTATAVGTAHPHVHRAASPILAPPPDVVAVFDPASVGGGGPLVRIASQHSQRSLARRRSRGGSAVSARRPAVKPLSGAAGGEPHSPVFEDDDDEKDAAVMAVDVKAGVVAFGGDNGDDDPEKCATCLDVAEEEEEAVAHAYPDGGYGWVVVLCCTTMCALTNGWGMNYGVFQQVTRGARAWLTAQYYTQNVFPDANTAVVSLAGTTQGFVGPCSGALSADGSSSRASRSSAAGSETTSGSSGCCTSPPSFAGWARSARASPSRCGP